MSDRELKFRAWDTTTKKMILLELQDVSNFSHSDYYKLMSWTGLTNESGEEIYEGDILSGQLHRYGYEVGSNWNKPYTGVVTWIQRDQLYGWHLVGASDEPMELLYATHRNVDFNSDSPIILEVVGNIYEHPELLKAKES